MKNWGSEAVHSLITGAFNKTHDINRSHSCFVKCPQLLCRWYVTNVKVDLFGIPGWTSDMSIARQVCDNYIIPTFKCIMTFLHCRTECNLPARLQMQIEVPNKYSGYKFTSNSLHPNPMSCAIMHSIKHSYSNQDRLLTYTIRETSE